MLSSSCRETDILPVEVRFEIQISLHVGCVGHTKDACWIRPRDSKKLLLLLLLIVAARRGPRLSVSASCPSVHVSQSLSLLEGGCLSRIGINAILERLRVERRRKGILRCCCCFVVHRMRFWKEDKGKGGEGD